MDKKFYNLDAERTLINQMVLDCSIIPNVYDTIKPDTFYSASYKRLYEILLSLARKCAPIDEVSFRLECDQVVNPSILDDCLDATFTAANWAYFAGEIKNCYTSRAINAVLAQATSDLTDSNGAEVANWLMAEVGKISSNISACEVHDINELTCNFISDLDDAVKNKKAYTGIPTGFENIDSITLGLQPEYIVIGARPSLGKTALGEQIALNTSGAFGGESVKTMFVELEMSPKQLTERAIANLAHVPINKLRTGMLSSAQLSKVALKAGVLGNTENFVPVTCTTRKISDIVSCIRREVRVNGVKIAFIDHIGLIRPDGNYKSAWEGVAEISHTLQQLQRELGIPIVVLSQVARAVEGKKPSLADLRGSGAIEEDADTIMFIERERQNDISESQIPTVINIQKNRNGACGMAHLTFMPQEVMFMDTKEDAKNFSTPSYSKAEDDFLNGRNDEGF